jgi:hypothetical protein
MDGVAEHFNHVILERVRAMLHASGLPRFLWAEAARHAVWLRNCMTTRALNDMTPWEAITSKKPDLSALREWGERCWVRLQKEDKLGGHVCEGHWVSIDDRSKGCRIYWLDTNPLRLNETSISTKQLCQLFVSRERI